MVDVAELAVLEMVTIPIFVLRPDAEGRLIYALVNDAWCKRSDRAQSDVIGKTVAEVFPNRYGSIAYDHHMQAALSRETTDYEAMLPFRDTFRNVHTTLTPMLGADGEVILLLGTAIDRTPDIAAQERQAGLQSVTSEIEDFVALAAHDLRTPMRNVQQLADMLREDFSDLGDGKLDLIDMLENVAVKATQLITDVLSHAQAMNVTVDTRRFGLRALCMDIFGVLDPYETHHLHVRPLEVTVDRTALQIVLRNLFDNAIKYCGRDAVTLTITAGAGPDGMVSFAVQDNGKGFKDPAIAFLDGGDLRVDSGFGLLGVRRLITARGGRIAAKNLDGGKGSVIEFTLPGQIAESADRESQEHFAIPWGPHQETLRQAFS